MAHPDPEAAGVPVKMEVDAAPPPPLPPYFPAQTARPPNLPKAYLNGTQDMFSLFHLDPIYDRAVRPYNPADPPPPNTENDAPKKPTKPPATYAHYVQGLAGRVKPPKMSKRAQRGVTLHAILHKPEYTPQRIVPFDRETIESAFKVESGEVPEVRMQSAPPTRSFFPSSANGPLIRLTKHCSSQTKKWCPKRKRRKRGRMSSKPFHSPPRTPCTVRLEIHMYCTLSTSFRVLLAFC